MNMKNIFFLFFKTKKLERQIFFCIWIEYAIMIFLERIGREVSLNK
jgi:hypothetical protein